MFVLFNKDMFVIYVVFGLEDMGFGERVIYIMNFFVPFIKSFSNISVMPLKKVIYL